MRINRKLIKANRRPRIHKPAAPRPLRTNLDSSKKMVKGGSRINPFSIVIPFSSERVNDLHRCLKYLNQCVGIHFCEVILVLYQNEFQNFNFSQYKNINSRVIFSKRNNEQNMFNLSHARNIGINIASYEWVLCIDCDLVIPKQLCQILSLKKIVSSTNSLFWTHRINVSDVDYPKNLDKYSPKTKFVDKAPFGFFHFFNKKTVQKLVGGYDENMVGWGAEDNDFVDRCKKANMSLICIKDYLRVYHTIHNYDSKWKTKQINKNNETRHNQNKTNNVVKLKNIGNIILPTIGTSIKKEQFKKKFLIFGSGPNISKLDFTTFSSLSKDYNTMGFGWFYKTKFIPDYYYCHEESFRSEQSKEIINYLLKAQKYKRTVLFTTREHINYIAKNNHIEIPAVEVFINCYKDTFWDISTRRPKLSLDKLWAESLLPPDNKLFLTRTQLEATINLCYVLGAEEIYLLGVELNNNNHFCQTDASLGKNVFHKELVDKINFNPNTDRHCSVMDYDNCLGVHESLRLIKKFLENKGVGLYSCDSNSLLIKEDILKYRDIGF